ncbi:unnamed protein product [Fusarium graminearum]|nr:unnamed protein product [Fusarium graminearum]
MPFTESLSHAGNFQQSSALWVRNRIKFKSCSMSYCDSLEDHDGEITGLAWTVGCRLVSLDTNLHSEHPLQSHTSPTALLVNRFARFAANFCQAVLPILKKPTVKINVPSITIKGAANSFLADIWQPDKDNPAKTAYGTVSFRAWFTPD